jgi:hypothetical protein
LFENDVIYLYILFSWTMIIFWINIFLYDFWYLFSIGNRQKLNEKKWKKKLNEKGKIYSDLIVTNCFRIVFDKNTLVKVFSFSFLDSNSSLHLLYCYISVVFFIFIRFLHRYVVIYLCAHFNKRDKISLERKRENSFYFIILFTFLYWN